MTSLNEESEWKSYQIVLIRLAAIAYFGIGMTWLYIFVFTNYRAHHRVVMIPVAIASMLLSAGLFKLHRVFVAISLFVAVAIAVLAIYLQLASSMFNLSLLSVTVASFLYVGVVAPTVYKRISAH